ncbi:MAG: helix-turn-helix domain-containing protein [Candidatus Caldarchaeum sp.]
MTPYRRADLLKQVPSMIGVVLLATVIIAFWQHEASMDDMMRRMMGWSMITMMLWMYLPVIVVAIVLIAFPVILYLYPMNARAEVMGLTEEEKKVVEFLVARGGGAEQREIAKSLGLSRLKTHRIVSSLKRREVVEVKPRGRTNIVTLKNNRCWTGDSRLQT